MAPSLAILGVTRLKGAESTVHTFHRVMRADCCNREGGEIGELVNGHPRGSPFSRRGHAETHAHGGRGHQPPHHIRPEHSGTTARPGSNPHISHDGTSGQWTPLHCGLQEFHETIDPLLSTRAYIHLEFMCRCRNLALPGAHACLSAALRPSTPSLLPPPAPRSSGQVVPNARRERADHFPRPIEVVLPQLGEA